MAAAGDAFPICVGTTHAGTDGCIAYSTRAQELGAKAVMVAPPKLARTNDAALHRHYVAVAEALDIPVVVQDFPPAVGGITMTPELIAGLADGVAPAAAPQARRRAVADEGEPGARREPGRADLRRARRHDVPGRAAARRHRHDDRLCVPRDPRATSTGRSRRGDRDRATEVFYKYCPLIRFENQPRINLALRKHIYHRRGVIASPRVRAPFTPVDPGTLADLDDLLTRLKLTTEIRELVIW